MNYLINNFRYALKGLYLNKTIYILIILQLTLSLSWLHTSIEAKNEIDLNFNRMLKQFDVSNVYQLKTIDRSLDYHSLKQKSVEDIINIRKEIENTIKNNNTFSYLQCEIGKALLFPIDKIDSTLYTDTINIHNKNYSLLNAVYVNPIYLEKFGIETHSGRSFNDTDFKLDPMTDDVPIIVGEDFKSYYNIGDRIEYYNVVLQKNMYYSIIGFIEPDAKLFISEFLDKTSVPNTNNIIITIPLHSDEYEKKYLQYMSKLDKKYSQFDEEVNKITTLSNSLILKTKEISLSEIEQNINIEMNRLGLFEVSVMTMDKKFEQGKEFLQRDMMYAGILFTIPFLFTIIGMIITFTNSINKRTKEFVIHILSGASKYDLCIRIIIEILILYIISIILIFIKNNIYFLLNNDIHNKIAIIEYPSVELVLFTLLISIITAVIPITKVSKLNISDILKGES